MGSVAQTYSEEALGKVSGTNIYGENVELTLRISSTTLSSSFPMLSLEANG